MAKDDVNINPEEDMKYEESLLDYGGKTNRSVVYRVNEDRSGIYLEAFALGGLVLHVKDIISYNPWNFGRVNKGSGQVGVYRLEDQNGNMYFAMIKDYRASEGDWRIMLVNIRNSEHALKSWLQMNSTYGFSFMDYTFPTHEK